MTRATSFRVVAALNISTAAGTVIFWLGFYSGILFPREVLRERIANFDGYYAWETAFTVPDLIMAAVMIFGGFKLLRNTDDYLGWVLLLAASGACIFLGVLDFTYDVFNRMYTLHHIFSVTSAMIDLCLPLVGIFSIHQLHKGGPVIAVP